MTEGNKNIEQFGTVGEGLKKNAKELLIFGSLFLSAPAIAQGNHSAEYKKANIGYMDAIKNDSANHSSSSAVYMKHVEDARSGIILPNGERLISSNLYAGEIPGKGFYVERIVASEDGDGGEHVRTCNAHINKEGTFFDYLIIGEGLYDTAKKSFTPSKKNTGLDKLPSKLVDEKGKIKRIDIVNSYSGEEREELLKVYDNIAQGNLKSAALGKGTFDTVSYAMEGNTAKILSQMKPHPAFSGSTESHPNRHESKIPYFGEPAHIYYIHNDREHEQTFKVLTNYFNSLKDRKADLSNDSVYHYDENSLLITYENGKEPDSDIRNIVKFVGQPVAIRLVKIVGDMQNEYNSEGVVKYKSVGKKGSWAFEVFDNRELENEKPAK